MIYVNTSVTVWATLIHFWSYFLFRFCFTFLFNIQVSSNKKRAEQLVLSVLLVIASNDDIVSRVCK